MNPALRGGDMVGLSDVGSVVRLCHDFPQQPVPLHDARPREPARAGVPARKFGNLMVFGCWWFLNNPSLIDEITRMRVELLGTSFIPQHSDARVLDQLIYKWDHSRAIIGHVLVDKYADLAATGWMAERGGDSPRRAADARRPRPNDDRATELNRRVAGSRISRAPYASS